MGKIGRRDKKDISASDIDRALWAAFGNYDYRLSNVYMFGSECDFFAISKSGYVVEVEIKISRADFKNDFKKKTSNGKDKHEYLSSESTFKPNQFYFAVPEGLIKPDEIPKEYGLIYYHYGTYAQIKKRAKYLHKEKLLDNKVFITRLLSKFYHRYMDLRRGQIISKYDLESSRRATDLFE